MTYCLYICLSRRKYKEQQAKYQRYCEKKQEKCISAPEEPVPDPELHWTPRTDYDLNEPPFRYYEDFKQRYLPLLKKEQQKTFLAKYKKAKSIEDE